MYVKAMHFTRWVYETIEVLRARDCSSLRSLSWALLEVQVLKAYKIIKFFIVILNWYYSQQI